MGALRGLAFAVLASTALLSAAGCKCARFCLYDPPTVESQTPPAQGGQGVTNPPMTRGGVVAIARNDAPLVPIGYVSYDPNDGRHSWWLMKQGEVVPPLQAVASGMPALPAQILLWTPIHETSMLPEQLCQQFSGTLAAPQLFEVFITADFGPCPGP